MPSYGTQLISKAIDDNDASAFTRLGIERDHFPTECERKAYDFFRKYADENRGQAPSYATVVGEIADFTYIPAVTDSYEFLTRKLKDSAGKRRLAELFNGEVAEQYGKLDTQEFITWLTSEVDGIKIGTQVRKLIGKTLVELKDEFRSEYQRRKEGKSFKLWKTPFEALNEEIGGLYTGDIYGVMAESGRGKSYVIIVLIDCLLRQGANVFIKSYELKAFLWLSRLLSVATACDGAITLEGFAEKVGIPNKAILSGKLDGEIEEYFFKMLDAINEYYPGNLYMQAKGDKNLTRSLADLDRELKQSPEIDVCVIDPIYGISDVYGRNSNNTAGGAAEQAVRRFEQIIGDSDVVGLFAIQAHVEKQAGEERETGTRELKPPGRDKVKTTKAALEIATNLFSFDSNDGNAKLLVDKGRNGGEGFMLELIALMDYGVLRELPKGNSVANQFSENF